MRILLVDHVCHRKTRSADFFLELLREDHEVRVHYYARSYACDLPAQAVAEADAIVFWEFLPDRYRIGIPGKRCVFVPMYDNEWGSHWQWRRLAASGMAIVSFCRAVSEHARACGVTTLLEAHFAFDPAAFAGSAGDPRRALYWDRGDFSEACVRSLFAPGALDELVVQRDFLPPADYAAFVARFGVVIAPRAKEGIGMAFLEPFARGKCVVAHDAPTMNEALVPGRSGILRDFRHPSASPITADEIAAVRRSVGAAAVEACARWQADREALRRFFATLDERVSPFRRSPVVDFARYLLFLLEGLAMRAGAFGKAVFSRIGCQKSFPRSPKGGGKRKGMRK